MFISLIFSLMISPPKLPPKVGSQICVHDFRFVTPRCCSIVLKAAKASHGELFISAPISSSLIPLPQDAAATAKADEGGDPQGPGACTVQGCNCLRYVGNQSSCRREYCWHGYGYRKIFHNWSSKSRLIFYVSR